jgi:hypothetical protein
MSTFVLCRSRVLRREGMGTASNQSKNLMASLSSTSTTTQLHFFGSFSPAISTTASRRLGAGLKGYRAATPSEVFILQPCVLFWRSSGFEAVCSRHCTPSGLIPGGTSVDRARKLRHGCGGEGARGIQGPDCFFNFCFRVYNAILGTLL